jgi:23S rRNA pseudouridine1911/1915/1917 synthase
MAHIHYPLVGDQVYGGRFQLPNNCNPDLEQVLRAFKRQALHATRLGLQHPETDEYCEWELPVPEDMAILIKTLADEALD